MPAGGNKDLGQSVILLLAITSYYCSIAFDVRSSDIKITVRFGGYMELISQAIRFAAAVFDGKKRKGNGGPSIFHALEAGTIAASLTTDEEILSAAVLHDVIEDEGITPEELEKRFGARVKNLVNAETEDKRRDLPADATWHIRKQEAIDILKNSSDTGIKIIFLSDKLSNLRSLYVDLYRRGDEIWQQFNQKDPREHYWYFRSIADALSELKEFPAWQEYDSLICRIFKRYDTGK